MATSPEVGLSSPVSMVAGLTCLSRGSDEGYHAVGGYGKAHVVEYSFGSLVLEGHVGKGDGAVEVRLCARVVDRFLPSGKLHTESLEVSDAS